MKQLVRVAESILKEMDDFFEKIRPKPNYLLDGDEILNIFLYIVSQSNVPNLPVQLKYISCFVPENVKTTIYGYYLTTLQASIVHIMQGGLEDDASLFKSIMRKTTDNYLLE
jgi:hypothetical protein